MLRARPSAAVPFPPISSGSPPGFDSTRLRLRPFGTEVEDLEVDFRATPRPFLETEILQRCAQFQDGSHPADDLIWDLEVGKRVECLLILSSLADARPFAVVSPCSADGCAERMEVELSLDELVGAQRQSESEALVEARRGAEVLQIRRPTGRDQLEFRKLRPADEAEAVKLMVNALVVPDSTPVSADWLPVIEEALEDSDPLVRLNLHANCPHCASSVQLAVDPGRLALERLEQAQKTLIRDVHRLASAYHWSEAEIIALPSWRRKAYLAELDREAR